MGFLIDTNVLSELRKKDRADPGVTSWYAGVQGEQLSISVLVVGEIRSCTHRRQIMQTRQEGLTKTCSRFHEPAETGADIASRSRSSPPCRSVRAAPTSKACISSRISRPCSGQRSRSRPSSRLGDSTSSSPCSTSRRLRAWRKVLDILGSISVTDIYLPTGAASGTAPSVPSITTTGDAECRKGVQFKPACR